MRAHPKGLRRGGGGFCKLNPVGFDLEWVSSKENHQKEREGERRGVCFFGLEGCPKEREGLPKNGCSRVRSGPEILGRGWDDPSHLGEGGGIANVSWEEEGEGRRKIINEKDKNKV